MRTLKRVFIEGEATLKAFYTVPPYIVEYHSLLSV